MSRNCLFPFSNLTVLPNGSVLPCCKYNIKNGNPNISDLTLYDNNIEELFFQPAMENIRDKFRKGEEPTECSLCWEEEASGITSLREHKNNIAKWDVPRLQNTFEHPQISSMDFKFSSLCNLKCRICGPYCSSNWLKEAQDTGLFHEHTIQIFSKYAERKFINNETNFEIFKKLIPHLYLIEFHGGEPLMQPEHSKIMDILNNYPHISDFGIHLLYNTNGTVYDELAVEAWNKLEKVELNFSIDDLGDRFEYERFLAKWPEVLSNIQKYKENCRDSVCMHLCCTVSLYNIFYVDELIKFNKDHLQLPIRFNLLHWPSKMSIKNLPSNVKEIIRTKISLLDNDSKKYIDPLFDIEGVLSYMLDNQQDVNEFNEFFTTTAIHDDYRKQSFKDTFSEYYNLLECNNIN